MSGVSTYRCSGAERSRPSRSGHAEQAQTQRSAGRPRRVPAPDPGPLWSSHDRCRSDHGLFLGNACGGRTRPPGTACRGDDARRRAGCGSPGRRRRRRCGARRPRARRRRPRRSGTPRRRRHRRARRHPRARQQCRPGQRRDRRAAQHAAGAGSARRELPRTGQSGQARPARDARAWERPHPHRHQRRRHRRPAVRRCVLRREVRSRRHHAVPRGRRRTVRGPDQCDRTGPGTSLADLDGRRVLDFTRPWIAAG